jgi:acyl carrier protein
MLSRQEIVNSALKCLRSICAVKGISERPPFNESTLVIGSESAVLDSLGAVMLLVQLEEALNTIRGSETLLVQRLLTEDLQAETVGTLADRALLIIGDQP